jgi:hypothetical protein
MSSEALAKEHGLHNPRSGKYELQILEQMRVCFDIVN